MAQARGGATRVFDVQTSISNPARYRDHRRASKALKQRRDYLHAKATLSEIIQL
ncbi:hypothetical protein Z949_2044 [Sulfitobacter guttiformis KCTC 32187]|nr:hypothetical protein Z949_2044 [Sulfitobacter guttiformis KCTC 32187]